MACVTVSSTRFARVSGFFAVNHLGASALAMGLLPHLAGGRVVFIGTGRTFLTFDPGLMPGNGLVRTAPWYERAAWRSLLRWAVRMLDDACWRPLYPALTNVPTA